MQQVDATTVARHRHTAGNEHKCARVLVTRPIDYNNETEKSSVCHITLLDRAGIHESPFAARLRCKYVVESSVPAT